MKKWLFSIVLALFALPCFAVNIKEDIHKSMHYAFITGPAGEGYCTIYAVGPNTILTAEHCLSGANEAKQNLFILDDQGTQKGPMAYDKELYLDGNDHALIVLEKLDVANNPYKPFDVWVKDLAFYTAHQGDKVYMYGATTSVAAVDLYREGMFVGYSIKVSDDDHIALFFDLRAAAGDSGALIFDDQNHLIGMCSFGEQVFTASYSFAFTQNELSKIK